MPQTHTETRDSETPKDGYGAAYIEHCLRADFEDLRRFVGFETARQIVADIINDAAQGKRS